MVSVVRDLVQGPERLTRWSRGLFVVYTVWFCNAPQLAGFEACEGEPVGRDRERVKAFLESRFHCDSS